MRRFSVPYEITQYLIAILIFSFLGYAQAQKIHVTVDILYNIFSIGVRRGINLLNMTVSLILMILISWKGWEKAAEAMETGDKLMNLPVPDYPFIFFLTIGCGIMSIEFVRDIIRTLFRQIDQGGPMSTEMIGVMGIWPYLCCWHSECISVWPWPWSGLSVSASSSG
jgi:TRAP-type C4-dicarboxylate transport system permease small subunit